MGYPNGGTKGPKPGELFVCNVHLCVLSAFSVLLYSYACCICFKGYGAKAGPSSGQGAKPNGKEHLIITIVKLLYMVCDSKIWLDRLLLKTL